MTKKKTRKIINFGSVNEIEQHFFPHTSVKSILDPQALGTKLAKGSLNSLRQRLKI